ncbi:MAG: beta-lactamase family protein, partial [Planctomycetaceae bacterium]|nr:beta-lactamase family protein [Planctomycetaceae bacterium]
MDRRHFLGNTLHAICGTALTTGAAAQGTCLEARFAPAADILRQSVADGQVAAASLWVKQQDSVATYAFGKATTPDAVFLLASISKTISVATIMTLFDERLFQLTDPVRRYIPEFSGEGREHITIVQLMTHTAGLPDQLPQNTALRTAHAPLSEFVAAAVRTPLLF